MVYARKPSDDGDCRWLVVTGDGSNGSWCLRVGVDDDVDDAYHFLKRAAALRLLVFFFRCSSCKAINAPGLLRVIMRKTIAGNESLGLSLWVAIVTPCLVFPKFLWNHKAIMNLAIRPCHGSAPLTATTPFAGGWRHVVRLPATSRRATGQESGVGRSSKGGAAPSGAAPPVTQGSNDPSR